MSSKMIGYVLIAAGVIVAAVALAADVIGIGNRQGIGPDQLIGAAAGVIVALVGLWLALRKSAQPK